MSDALILEYVSRPSTAAGKSSHHFQNSAAANASSFHKASSSHAKRASVSGSSRRLSSIFTGKKA